MVYAVTATGVPAAHHDLEMLLKNGNTRLQDTYTKLPSFLQKLIEKLPEKWADSLAPEVLAAASEKAAQSGVNTENVAKAAAAADKMGLKIPSLKELVGKPAAIVGMLRSIVAFLKARFPAIMGVNVLWSLALSSKFTDDLGYGNRANVWQFFYSSSGTAINADAKFAWRTNASSPRKRYGR